MQQKLIRALLSLGLLTALGVLPSCCGKKNKPKTETMDKKKPTKKKMKSTKKGAKKKSTKKIVKKY